MCAQADPTGPLVRWEQGAKAVSTLPSSGAHPRWRMKVCQGERPKAPRRKPTDKTKEGARTVPAYKTRRAHSIWRPPEGPACPHALVSLRHGCSHMCGWVGAHRMRARTHSSAVLQLLRDATALTVTDDDVVDPTQTPVALWVRTGAVRRGPAGRGGSAWDPSLRPKPIAG